jgi:hypothetical protein
MSLLQATRLKLGDVLRLLGQRKKNASLIWEALDSHAAACQVCLRDTPYWAFRAADAAAEDLSALSSSFDRSEYEAFVTKPQWVFNLRSKHQGHKIALVPTFNVVVAGKTGERKPDWKLAPRRGDRIKDGSVVWENAGACSYCLECKEYLVPPGSEIPRPFIS